jgi:hypothetical protein
MCGVKHGEPTPVILEGLLTTLDADGSTHVAAMGAEVAEEFARLVLRPYQTSHTFHNLQRTREGVFHVTDNVEMIAQAVVGHFPLPPRQHPAPVIRGTVLEDACRWYALAADTIDDSTPRATIVCRVVGAGRQRDFFGLNRAKHAVVEAAILATRLGRLPPARIQEDLQRLRPLVDKTGGAAERRAFALLEQYIQGRA